MAYRPEHKRKILDTYRKLVEAGTTVLVAAKKCGVPYFTISRWLKAAGEVVTPNTSLLAKDLAGRRRQLQYTKEQQDALIAKYEHLVAKGARVLDAAKTCGVVYLTIRRWQDARAGRPSYPKHENTGRPARTGRKPTSSRVSEKEPGGARYTLITHDGFRIESNSARELAEVLKRL